MSKKKKGGGKGCLFVVTLLIMAVIGGLAYLWWPTKSWEGLKTEINSLSRTVQSIVKSSTEKLAEPSKADKKVAYRFAILSDSHEDTTVFPKIVGQIAARQDLSFVAFLGDASNAGELSKLREAKAYLDNIEIPVHVIPGDHDRNWLPQRDLRNYKQTFGVTATSFSFSKGDESFIFIDNSDSTNGIDAASWAWLEGELEKRKETNMYVFMSTPLYNPYLSFKTMGSQNEAVKDQAGQLADLLSGYPVQVIFAGDTHTYSQYKDEEHKLSVVTVGSAGTNKNFLPLYVEVEIYSDGSYNATSIPYKEDGR